MGHASLDCWANLIVCQSTLAQIKWEVQIVFHVNPCGTPPHVSGQTPPEHVPVQGKDVIFLFDHAVVFMLMCWRHASMYLDPSIAASGDLNKKLTRLELLLEESMCLEAFFVYKKFDLMQAVCWSSAASNQNANWGSKGTISICSSRRMAMD